MHSDLPCLYPISSGPGADRRGHLALILEFLRGGARLVQVREKRLTDEALMKLLPPVVRACHAAGARLIVNDRPRLAMACSADGVHLGQQDVAPAAARKRLGAGALIGLSTHNRDQFEVAVRDPSVDYVSVGPIFPTTGKADPDPVVGLESLRRLARGQSKPVVAIGGIRLENAAETWAAGAGTVAVISDLCESTDPSRQVQRYLQLQGQRHGHA